LLHICRQFLHPQPEDAPCPGDRETLVKGNFLFFGNKTRQVAAAPGNSCHLLDDKRSAVGCVKTRMGTYTVEVIEKERESATSRKDPLQFSVSYKRCTNSKQEKQKVRKNEETCRGNIYNIYTCTKRN
jgi:hypothetical protein